MSIISTVRGNYAKIRFCNKGNALTSVTDENAIFNPVTAAKEFEGGAVVGGILGGAQTAVNAAVEAPRYLRTAEDIMAGNAQGTVQDAQNAQQAGKSGAAAQNAVAGLQMAAEKPLYIKDENGMDYKQRATWERQLQAVPQEKRSAFQEAQAIAQKFGASLNVEELENAAGEYKNGQITINPRSQNPVRDVLLHELTHHMETGGMYGQFQSKVMNYLTESGVNTDAMLELIKEDYAAAGKTLTDEQAKRELVAKYAESKLFRDEATVQRLLVEDRNMFRRIYDWIRDAVKKARGTSEERFLIEAQNLYEKALRQATGQSQGVEYSIKNTKGKSWEEQMKMKKNHEMQSSDSYFLGESNDLFPPEFNIDNGNVVLNQGIRTKAERESKGSKSGHGEDSKVIESLDKEMRNSAAIAYNPSRNSVVFISRNVENGKPLVVSIELNKDLYGEKAHSITSIHSRDSIVGLLKNIGADGQIVVKNKNELDNLLSGIEVQSLKLLANIKLGKDNNTSPYQSQPQKSTGRRFDELQTV